MAPPAEPGRNTTRLLAAAAVLLLGVFATRHFVSPPRPMEIVRPTTSLNINTATKTELLQVPGLGPATVDAILAHRSQVGAFETLEELDKVPGIGAKTVEKFRPWLTAGRVAVDNTVERLERKKPAPASGRININTASVEELQSLPAIGPVLAERMIAARPFKTIDELRRVPGIGVKTLEKLRPHVQVE